MYWKGKCILAESFRHTVTTHIEQLQSDCGLEYVGADPEQMAWRGLGTVYGDIKQRWVVVYSPAAYRRALKTVNQYWLKQSSAEFKDLGKLDKREFACEADARQALVAFEKKLKATFVAEAQISALPRFEAQGREPAFYV